MSLIPLVPVDTRSMFRPVAASLVDLLRRLEPDDWAKPTMAGHWIVRDVLAHMLDVSLRRLSFHRDRRPPPPPARPISSDRDFVDFINDLNAQWVASTKRLSPRALTDWYATASRELADWFESVPLEAPALFGVSWAGERESAGWFDIGREFTELWHHQRQIRIAVGAVGAEDPRYLHAVIDVAMRGLPHAMKEVAAAADEGIAIDVTGPAGGQWALRRDDSRWTLWSGVPNQVTGTIRMDADTAWQWLFNALSRGGGSARIEATGRRDLIDGLMRARSVIV